MFDTGCAPRDPHSGCGNSEVPAVPSFDDLVVDYCENFKGPLERFLDGLAKEDGTGMERFVRGGKKDRKHPHQWRLSNKTIFNAANELSRHLSGTTPFKDFEELYDAVWAVKVNKDLKGFGRLADYDFSLRYGHNLTPRVEPMDYVYIHQGALEGAKRLYAKGGMTAAPVTPRQRVTDFCQSLQALGAMHMENFLCIYKDKI